jgi:hypothetical protein
MEHHPKGELEMSYGNNNRGNGNGKDGGGNAHREKADYLRASSVTKTIHSNTEDKKERVEYSFDETEEVSLTLTHEKANDLISRLQAAMEDESGTGGVRISMYGKRSKNKTTGEVFDGLGLLIYAQKPPQEGRGRGSFNSNKGGGRRSYPPQQQASRPLSNGRTTSDPRNGQRSQTPKSDSGTSRNEPRKAVQQAGYMDVPEERQFNSNQYDDGPNF